MSGDSDEKLEHLSEQVADLTRAVDALTDRAGQYVTRDALADYLTVRAFDDRLERLAMDVLTKVTASMQAMFNDAVKEATTIAIETYTETEAGKEWFREALAADRAQARRERREDFGALLTRGRAAVLWVIPIVTIINVLGQILSWW